MPKRIVKCPKGHEIATEKEKGESVQCKRCGGTRYNL